MTRHGRAAPGFMIGGRCLCQAVLCRGLSTITIEATQHRLQPILDFAEAHTVTNAMTIAKLECRGPNGIVPWSDHPKGWTEQPSSVMESPASLRIKIQSPHTLHAARRPSADKSQTRMPSLMDCLANFDTQMRPLVLSVQVMHKRARKSSSPERATSTSASTARLHHEKLGVYPSLNKLPKLERLCVSPWSNHACRRPPHLGELAFVSVAQLKRAADQLLRGFPRHSRG